MLLHEQGLDDIVVEKLGLDVPPADLTEWQPGGGGQEQPGPDGQHRDGRQVREPARLLHLAQRSADARRAAHAHPRQHRASSRRPTSRSTAPAALDGHGRDPGAGRLRRARHRGQDRRPCATRASNGIPYLGICLGMQLAVIEYARNVAGLAGAHSTEFNRATPHPVIALITEWQDQRARLEPRSEKSRTSAAPCASARRKCAISHGSLAHAVYGADVIRERHRHRYEFNNTLPAAADERGPALLGLLARRPGRDHRAAARTRCSSPASSIPSSPPRRATGTRCSPASSRRRATHRALRSCRRRQAHEALRLRGRHRPAVLPDRRSLRHRERGAGARHRRAAAGDHRARSASPTSSRPPSTRPTAPRGKLPRPGHRAGPEDPRRGAARSSACRCSPTCTKTRRMAEVAAVVDVLQTPAFLCRQTNFIVNAALAGQARQHQEGPVPVALGDAQRGRQGALHRQRADHGLRARLQLRLQQPGRRHALAGRDARDRLPGRVRRHAFGAAAGRQGRRPPAASASSCRCWRARPSPPASSGVFMETHPDPAKALSDGPNAWPLDRMQSLLDGAEGASMRAVKIPAVRGIEPMTKHRRHPARARSSTRAAIRPSRPTCCSAGGAHRPRGRAVRRVDRHARSRRAARRRQDALPRQGRAAGRRQRRTARFAQRAARASTSRDQAALDASDDRPRRHREQVAARRQCAARRVARRGAAAAARPAGRACTGCSAGPGPHRSCRCR